MAVQSFSELKAENAKAEQETESVEQDITDEVEQEAEAVIEESEQVDADSEDANEETSEEKANTEPWMVADDGSDDKGFIPDSGAAAVRKKLKGQLKQKDSEIESLRAEVEALKTAKVEQPVENTGFPPKPKKEDFDYDDERFTDALVDWKLKQQQAKATKDQQKQQQDEQLRAEQQKVESATSEHYQRAAKLINDTSLTEDTYRQADSTLRQAMDSLAPGYGDALTDRMIASLGEGSEKIVVKLGVDPTALNTLVSKYQQDRSGLSAMAFLGQLQAKFSGAKTTQVSSAPKPAKQIQGDGSKAVPRLKRDYDKAHKTGDIGKAIRLKREAKKAGHDTKHW